MTPLTIAFITSRANPRWDWFISALSNQVEPFQRKDLQLVFIDGRLWAGGSETFRSHFAMTTPGCFPIRDTRYHDRVRREELADVIGGRFEFLHVPPKPNVWSGPFRLTKTDWFTAANARNTAIVVARHPYLVCVDDLSVPTSIWFAQALHAASHGYVVCGAYKKVKNLVVEKGNVVSFDEFPEGRDSRWDRGSDTGIVPYTGAGMYGCSFGVPLELALTVDGNDGVCNGMGFEDWDFGLRVERAGGKVFYNRNMLTLESEEAHHEDPTPKRESLDVTTAYKPDGYEGNTKADWVFYNRIIRETGRITPLMGENLRAIRECYFATGTVPIPPAEATNWMDGRKLSEI